MKRPLMSLQSARSLEYFLAQVTRESAVVCMSQFVLIQIASPIKRFIAKVTVKLEGNE